MTNFTGSLSTNRVFRDTNVLSPHFVPEVLPFREQQINEIRSVIAPALENKKPRNLFVYGKTGTGKTVSVKRVMETLNGVVASIQYINCRIYNSRYRVLQKALKNFIPELEKSGFGLPFLYEKMIEIASSGKQLILVLDEIDMTKDLDELIYTLTRANDEIKGGGVSIIGISNKLSFKDALDPRSKSSLYETEMVFPPYTSEQLREIIKQRAELGLNENVIDQSAINLTAAITAQENGDARYALKLLYNAAELAEHNGKNKISDEEVELARKKVDIDIASETVATLPENHQMVLFSIANISLNGSRYARLDVEEDGFLFSGEIYEEYERTCKKLHKRARSVRWYHEYISDLEMLGLISTKMSSKGIRGHTTLIKLGHDAKGILEIVGKNLGC
ncbi:AAA family ATPase [Candidatus Micrarchaeota archaeon]|nr:AAA family ATPase [Candidatus Micrarchaeota archaeon]